MRRSAAFCSKSLINDLGCEEARQWYAISYLGKRWWATYASPRRDGTGLQRFQVGAAENAWRPAPPPCPLLSHAVGEEGEMSGAGAILRWHLSPMPCLPPRSPRSRAAGEGPGVRVALTAPRPPPLPRCGRGGGEMSGAGAILRWHLSPMPCLPPRSPRSRAAGEGPGVRVARTQ